MQTNVRVQSSRLADSSRFVTLRTVIERREVRRLDGFDERDFCLSMKLLARRRKRQVHTRPGRERNSRCIDAPAAAGFDVLDDHPRELGELTAQTPAAMQ